jgi:hypothetical protein
MADDVTEAHEQRMTVHILSHVPEHQPRESDPHYHLFMQAKARMKRQGLWRCAINDDYCAGNIELHHTHIEFSQSNAMDLKRVNEAFGMHLDDDDEFQAWIESPGNLEPLCEVHHRTHYGVHMLPHPLWEPLRYRKHATKASAEIESVEGADVEVSSSSTKATSTRATKAGADTTTDTTSKVKVSAGGHTVDQTVEKAHVEQHHTAPQQRQKEKGLFSRMFGR